VVGHSIVFTYSRAALKPTADLIRNLEPLVSGDVLAPVAVEDKLARRFRLLGTQGLVGMTIAAIDMALWDALARLHGASLMCLLGGTAKPLRAYGAVGYEGAAGCARTAEDWARRGFAGVKAKIGYPTVQEDVAVIRAMRKAVGPSVAIMVDYNQCLTPAEAVERARRLDEEDLTWIEEATLAHDYVGHAIVARGAHADPANRTSVHPQVQVLRESQSKTPMIIINPTPARNSIPNRITNLRFPTESHRDPDNRYSKRSNVATVARSWPRLTIGDLPRRFWRRLCALERAR
jgi:L-alanine-DL-glutamate epimerase-like enolase superfamily enzyme